MQESRATDQPQGSHLLLANTQDNCCLCCFAAAGNAGVILTDGEKDEAFTYVAHLREGIAECLEKDFPIINQGGHGFGQVGRCRCKRGFFRQQVQQWLKLPGFSSAEEFRNDALVRLASWRGGGFFGGNPLSSTLEDLPTILFVAVHYQSNISVIELKSLT